MSTTEPDRRRHPRVSIDLPVKVRNQFSGKYGAGQAVNISAGGAMLRLSFGPMLTPGQPIRVGIAGTRRSAVIPAESMRDATVIRSHGLGRAQHVAVRFEAAAALADAG